MLCSRCIPVADHIISGVGPDKEDLDLLSSCIDNLKAMQGS
jgi:hypothetical protein